MTPCNLTCSECLVLYFILFQRRGVIQLSLLEFHSLKESTVNIHYKFLPVLRIRPCRLLLGKHFSLDESLPLLYVYGHLWWLLVLLSSYKIKHSCGNEEHGSLLIETCSRVVDLLHDFWNILLISSWLETNVIWFVLYCMLSPNNLTCDDSLSDEVSTKTTHILLEQTAQGRLKSL